MTGTAPSLQQQLPQQTGQGSKIIVSNLPPDVTEPQIRELFASTVGQVTKVALSFDARGTSKGVAQVEFKRNEDATKAFQQYNKVRRIRPVVAFSRRLTLDSMTCSVLLTKVRIVS